MHVQRHEACNDNNGPISIAVREHLYTITNIQEYTHMHGNLAVLIVKIWLIHFA